MSEEILSPPYPAEGQSADGLFNSLKALRKWVLYYRKSLNTELGQDLIPNVIVFPDKVAYLSQPVSIQYGHLIFIRRIRECWDNLIRTYEDAWDCAACVRQQALLVQTSAVTLNCAFVPFETREANAKKDQERMQKTFECLLESLQKHMSPESFDTREGQDKG